MGLFDMFGAGGGALQIQVMGQATSGGTLTGNLVFTGASALRTSPTSRFG